MKNLVIVAFLFFTFLFNVTSAQEESADSSSNMESKEPSDKSEDELSWFFIKFGDSSHYEEYDVEFDEGSFDQKHYEMLLAKIESGNSDSRLVWGIINSLYKFADHNPNNPVFKSLHDRMYKEDTLNFLASQNGELLNFLPKEYFKYEYIRQKAVIECNWIRSNKSVPKIDGLDWWRKLPGDIVQLEAFYLMPCTKDLKAFFFENKFAQNSKFVIDYVQQAHADQNYKIELLIKHLIELYKSLPNSIQTDLSVVKSYIENSISIYPVLDDSLKKNRKIAVDSLDKENTKVPERQKKHRGYEQSPFFTDISNDVIKFFPKDKEIIEKALLNSSDGQCVELVSDEFFSNIDLILKWIELNPKIFLFLKEPARSNKKVALMAIQKEPEINEKYLSEKLKGDLEFMKTLLPIYPNGYLFCSDDLKKNVDLIKLVVTTKPELIMNVPEPESLMPEIIQLSVSKAIPKQACWIPEKAQLSKKIMYDAVKVNRYCLKFVSPSIYDKDFHVIMTSGSIIPEFLPAISVKFKTDVSILDSWSNWDISRDKAILESYLNVDILIMFLKKNGIEVFTRFYEEFITTEENYGYEEESEEETYKVNRYNSLDTTMDNPKFIAAVGEYVKNKKIKCSVYRDFFESIVSEDLKNKLNEAEKTQYSKGYGCKLDSK